MINILPYNQKKSIERLRLLRVASVTIWALTLLSAAAMVLLVPLFVTINSRFAITGGQIAELERAGIVVNSVDVAALSARAEVLAKKLASPEASSPIDYISVVRSIPATGITLSGYTVEEGGAAVLEVAGTAATRESLQRFITSLESHERIESVESPVSNYVKSTKSPFSITVTFKSQ